MFSVTLLTIIATINVLNLDTRTDTPFDDAAASVTVTSCLLYKVPECCNTTQVTGLSTSQNLNNGMLGKYYSIYFLLTNN